MDTPSFKNLDESQVNSVINSLEGNLNNIDLSNIDNNISKVNDQLNKVADTIAKLRDPKNNNILDTSDVQKNLDDLISKFSYYNKTINDSMALQTANITQVVSQLGNMSTLMENIGVVAQKLETAKIGDTESGEKFLQLLQNMQNSFDNLNRNTDFMDIKPENLEESKRNLDSFFNNLSNDMKKYCNFGDIIADSLNNPEMANNLKATLADIMKTMNDMPATFSDKFKQALEDAKNQSRNFNDIQIPSPPPPGMGSGNPVFEQQQIENINKNIMDAFIKGFEGHIDRMSSAKHNAQEFGSNMNNINKNVFNADAQTQTVQNNFDSYSALERKRMNDAGLDKEGLHNLQGGLNDLVKYTSSYQNQQINLASATNNFSKVYSEFEKDPSADNMKKVQDASKEVEKQTNAASEITLEMMSVISKLSDVTNMSVDKYDKLPEDVKKMLDLYKQIEQSAKNSAKNLAGMSDDFPMNSSNVTDLLKKGISESNDELGKMTDIFGNLKKDAASVFSPIKSVIGDILGGIGKIGSTMNALGLGVGIPISINDMKAYVKSTVEWYKKFAQMDVSSAQAQLSTGVGGVNNNILTQNRQMGMDLQLRTYGLINYNDYANMSNGLISGVQGHYGQGNDKASGISDMQSLTTSALELNKVYGVDSQSAVSTFYKELNMNAGKTQELLLQLAGTAQAANIPVAEYTKTVGNLALQFKDAGLGVESVTTGMRNLTLNGMSLSTASSLISDVGGAANKFTQSTGNAMYFGMQSGAGSNPFSAYNALNLRWDANGNPITGADHQVYKAMDSALNMYTGAYGNNPDVKTFGMQQVLKNQFGISNAKDVSMLTQRFMSGDQKGFEDLLTKKMGGDDKPPGQQDLEDKLETAANYTDELTKAQMMNTHVQQELATINKGLLDMIGKGLQKLIATLGSAIINLSNKITGLISALGGIANVFTSVIASFFGIKMGTKFGGLGGASGISKMKDMYDVSKGTSRTLGDAGAAGSLFGKTLGKAPIIGGLIDGGITFGMDKMGGMTTGYSAGDAIGSGVGTGLGGWGGAAAGAAAGTLIVPGIGTVIGGVIGGIAGAYGGGAAGKWGADKVMNYAGVQQYEDGSSASDNDSTYNTGLQYSNGSGGYNFDTSGAMTSADDFYKAAGVNQSDFQSAIDSSDTAVKNTNIKLQAQTNDKLDQVKDTNSTLMGKSNQLSIETYNLNNSKYSEMINHAKDQFEQLTNIAKITDAGFTFLDKILNDIYNKIGSFGSGGNGGSSGSSSSHQTYGSGSGNVNQSLKVSDPTDGLSADDINAWIDKNTQGKDSVMKGKGNIFLQAAKESGLDVKYLVAHAAQETGWGTSSMVKNKGNWFGIGAFNANPNNAYGYSSTDQGIIDGANWIAKNYTDAGQDTLWKMIHSSDKHDYAVYDDGSPNTEWMNNIASIMANGPVGSTSNSSNASSGYAARKNQTDVQALKNNSDSDSGGYISDLIDGNVKTTDGAAVTAKISNSTNSGTDNWYDGKGNIVGTGALSGHDYDANGVDRLQNSSSNANASISSDSGAHYSSNMGLISNSSGTGYNLTSGSAKNTGTQSTAYVIGSVEYSNGIQHYDPKAFQAVDDLKMKNIQGMARGMALYYDKSAQTSQYAGSINAADDNSSAYNSKKTIPDFHINIATTGGTNADYQKMADQIQTAVTQIVQQNMGNTVKVAASNYQRNINQY